MIYPNSEGYSNDIEAQLREMGWSPAARAAAIASRRAKMKSKTVSSRLSKMKTDAEMHSALQTYGPEANKQIRTNLSIRLGAKTKTGVEIGSTFMSNDRKQLYSGRVRGMRQKIMSWAKANGKTLPNGFENRSPMAVAGMFRGMTRSGYFK